MKKNVYDILESPIITEKSTRNTADYNQYTFKVHRHANKNEIKEAVEKNYNVDVIRVNIMNVRGKEKRVRQIPGRTSSWKKALIQLKEGQTIDFT